MSSRRSLVLPLVLMGLGLALLLTAVWWAWQSGQRDVAVAVKSDRDTPAASAATPVFYRPANSDWWLILSEGEPRASAAASAVRSNLPQLDPGTPDLPRELPDPVAMAAAGALRLWQFAPGTPVKTPAATDAGRWHVETLSDATVLFWLPATVTTTAVDRIRRPSAGTGMVQRRWLQQRLGWPASSCEPLPALLEQLPEQALLQFDPGVDQLRWQLYWQQLPAALATLIASVGAPQALADPTDSWFWREADLSALPRAEGCPVGSAGAGFVARLWQENSQWHAALARPGQQELSGFPLPLPDGLTLAPSQLAGGRGLASDAAATAWLQQQSLLPETGLLLTVRHHGDSDFAGLALSLRSDTPGTLRLQWQWPLP